MDVRIWYVVKVCIKSSKWIRYLTLKTMWSDSRGRAQLFDEKVENSYVRFTEYKLKSFMTTCMRFDEGT